MQTRILNIRASQPNGTVRFSGIFTGYRDAEQTSVSLNVDPKILENANKTLVETNAYSLSIEVMDVET